MIRRSLRIGIRLGMLAGLAFALFKIVEARRPLPAVPPDDDPWAPPAPPTPTRAQAPTSPPRPAATAAPTAGPAPAPSPVPATEPDEPELVEPTMLRTTSLRRRRPPTDERTFDAASTAPPVVSPADPFAPSAIPTPGPAPLAIPEIEPDDDEIVILSTGRPDPTPAQPVQAREASREAARVAEAPPAPPRPPAAAPATMPARKATPQAGSSRTTSPAKAASPVKSRARATLPAKAPTKTTTKTTTRTTPPPGATAKKASKKAPAPWVEPTDGVCPTTHPVKGKLRSAIFHLPGMAFYARTNPDRCYRDEAAALDDGLRKAAR